MATHKEATHYTLITASLTDEEYELLEAFAAEQGIQKLEQAIPALLHELVRLHDEQWDAQFAKPHAVIDQMAREALEEDRAGLTIEDEDFDNDIP